MSRVLALLLLVGLATPALGQHYAETKGWRFENFNDAVFPWEVYRDTFIGVAPNNDAWASAFDVLFYDQVYKSELSKEGNCYGMSLQSLMMVKKGGHMGFCVPCSQYSGDISNSGPAGESLGPTDPMLKRVINIMHGHQVNLPTLQLILQVFALNKNRNASYAYTAFLDARMHNDPTLVSITKSLLPSEGGHTMVAYDAQDLGGGNKRIYVYDPNRTWALTADRVWYTGDPATATRPMNYIQINGNAWSFDKGGEVWSGDPSSGGNLIITPISVTGPHSRSPASLGDQIIGQILNSLFLSGSGADIEQVSDSGGKRLFRPGTREVDIDPATGMMTMLPWFPSDQNAGRNRDRTVFFHIGRPSSSLHVTVRSSRSGYTLTTGGPDHQVVVTSSGGNGSDVVSLHEPGSLRQRVELLNLSAAAAYDVQLVQTEPDKQRTQVFRASRIALPMGASLKIGVEDSHNALTLETAESLRYDMNLSVITPKGTQELSRVDIVQEAGISRTIRPRDWRNLRASEVLEADLPLASERRRATDARPRNPRGRDPKGQGGGEKAK